MPWNSNSMFPWLTGQKKPKQKSIIEQRRDDNNAAINDALGLPPAPAITKKKR